MVDAALLELFDTGTRVFPVFPQDRPESAGNPVVDGAEPSRYFGMAEWFGIKNISAGIFGIPTAFIVTYVVSLMTPAPPKEMQDFVDAIRIPRGQTLMQEK